MMAENWKLCQSCKVVVRWVHMNVGYIRLSKRGEKFDIVAGTSIGAINAAIIRNYNAFGVQLTYPERILWNNMTEKWIYA